MNTHWAARARTGGTSRPRFIIAALAGCSFTLACGDGGMAPALEPPSPTTVAVSPTTTELTALGATAQLTAEVRDQNGQAMPGAPVTWSSSDPAVATVGAAGLVTAVANGSVTVTATAGSASGTAAVTVAQQVGAVAILPDGGSVVERDTVRFEARAADTNGRPVAGAGFSWASSDTLVAVVDDAGLVTGVGAGEAEVTATAQGVTGRAGLTVIAAVPTTLTVTPDTVSFASLGDTVRLVAEVRDQLARLMEGESVAWSSTDSLVAMVGVAGLVTAVGNGSVTVTATSGEASDQVAVSVEQRTAMVAVSPASETLVHGDTVRLSAEATDANGHTTADAHFEWSSSDTLVAVVDDAGLVTGVGAGQADVMATTEGVTGRASLTVVATVPTTLTIAPATVSFASLGDTVRLVAEVRDQLARVMEGHPVAWSSSDASVASVDGAGLVAATGNGTATITASAGEASASATVIVRQAVSAVDLEIDSVTVAVGETLRLAAITTDANGHTVTGAAIKWSSSAPNIVSVDAAGLIRGTSRGTAVVSASSGTAADSAMVTVHDPSLVTVTGIEPTVLIEGRVATIHGWGFSTVRANNTVSIGGVAATVTAAGATRLSIMVPRSDCLPPRGAELRVAVGSQSDARMVGVTPRSPEDLALPPYSYRYTPAGNGCIHLPGSPSEGEYLIGVVSVSEEPSSLTAITLNGTPGDATVVETSDQAGALALTVSDFAATASSDALATGGAGVRAAPAANLRFEDISAGADSFRIRRAGVHGERMARNEALLRELGPSPIPRAAANRYRDLVAGDRITLYENTRDWSCQGTERVTALVRLVGRHTIWLEDVTNPSGTFADSELAELDTFYTENAKPVIDDYFGKLSDVDGNGRILILMTQAVNVNSGRPISGGVWTGDLLPKSSCPASNHAEIYYASVPDPDGVLGPAVTKQRALAAYPAMLTHEVTHLAQLAATYVFGTAGRKKSWELEGGAELAMQLVGYRLWGHGSGQDLGHAELVGGRGWYHSWFFGLSEFFGWDREGGRVRYAPEQCTWIGRPSEGNNGPCKNGWLAVYGVPSLVFRYALDRWGGAYPGGEQALMTRLTQSPAVGFASLEDVSSWRIERILADFYSSLWLDLQQGVSAPGMASWNLRDVFSRYDHNQQLEPYVSRSTQPHLTRRVRAGSSLYLHWTPSGRLSPTSIRVTSADGRPIPDHISVWALRIR